MRSNEMMLALNFGVTASSTNQTYLLSHDTNTNGDCIWDLLGFVDFTSLISQWQIDLLCQVGIILGILFLSLNWGSGYGINISSCVRDSS
jgi:hypothetical protein